jgi:hypothetical protein
VMQIAQFINLILLTLVTAYPAMGTVPRRP